MKIYVLILSDAVKGLKEKHCEAIHNIEIMVPQLASQLEVLKIFILKYFR